MPPDVVKRALLDLGMTDLVLDKLAQIARTSDGPEAQLEALRIINEYGLGLILLADDDTGRGVSPRDDL